MSRLHSVAEMPRPALWLPRAIKVGYACRYGTAWCAGLIDKTDDDKEST